MYKLQEIFNRNRQNSSPVSKNNWETIRKKSEMGNVTENGEGI